MLIYAHESGITLLWRGGKRLKSSKQPASHVKQNGTAPDEPIDLDNVEGLQHPTKAYKDTPEFEDIRQEEETALPEIIQTLDLSLGTAALRVAVLPMPPITPEVATSGGPAILEDRMVFAVSCATAQVYLITLPLTPPSHQAKSRPKLKEDLLAGNAGNGTWGETMSVLTGQTRRSDGIALSLASSKQEETRVIVASHNREASGILRLWDVNLDVSSRTNVHLRPFQTNYLPTPLTAITFNPAHTTQLLTVASPHAVRIYDYAQRSIEEDPSEDTYPTQGSWLLSLYPPFSRGPSMSTFRKPVVAAEWIAHGRAVLALLGDGQWGIWDVEGTGPSTAGAGNGNGLFSKQAQALRGAALTNFSVTGYLEGTSPLRNPSTQKSASGPGSAREFMPMTPHTRRDAMATSLTGGAEKLATVKGGIEVVKAAPLRSASATGHNDETAVLWLGSADPVVAVIPSVSKFWEAQMRRGVGGGVNLFSGPQPARMIRLADLGAGLLGELCTGVGAVSRPAQKHRESPILSDGVSSDTDGSSPKEQLPIDVLIRGDSRLVMVRESEDGTPLSMRLAGTKRKQPTDRSTNAIIAYPPREKPTSLAFNLTSQRGASLAKSRSGLRPSVKRLFEPEPLMQAGPNLFARGDAAPTTQRRPDVGLAFTQSLYSAADAMIDEAEVNERDVEGEMLDIMEIDRELEEMEVERVAGQRNVFFEDLSA